MDLGAQKVLDADASSKMSILTRLAPELLRNVVDYLGGSSLVNLWLIGSRQLHYAMSERGAVTRASFRLRGSLTSSRLPGMLGSLKSLTSLTIDAAGVRIGRPWRIWRVLSKLTFLQTLSLYFVGAEEWMFYDAPQVGSLFAESEDDLLAEDSVLELRPIASTFPHLVSLKLAGRPLCFVNNDLAKLPPSLTHLDLSLNPRINWKCFDVLAKFPKIASLHISRITEALDEAIRLPPTLTSIEIGSGLAIAPKTFWNGCNMVSIRMSMSLYHAKDIPGESLEVWRGVVGVGPETDYAAFPRLTELFFATAPPRPLRGISPTLRTLSISIESFEPGDALDLPSTVTYLRLFCNRDINIEAMFPVLSTEIKGLKKLILGGLMAAIYDSPDTLALLPKCLTHLECTPTRGLVGPPMRSLPANLVELYAPKLIFLESALSQLPASLASIHCTLRSAEDPTQLNLSKSQLAKVHFDLQRDSHTSPELIEAFLTSSLTFLKIDSGAKAIWSLESVKRLPRSLRTLSLQFHSMEPGGIDSLPNGLTELSLEQSTDTERSCIDGNQLNLLPRSLIRLTLLLGPIFEIIDEDLASLPRYLHFLRLNTRRLTVKGLRFLPPNCTYYGPGPLFEAFDAMSNKISQNFQDPDPRTIGGDLKWI